MFPTGGSDDNGDRLSPLAQGCLALVATILGIVMLVLSVSNYDARETSWYQVGAIVASLLTIALGVVGMVEAARRD